MRRKQFLLVQIVLVVSLHLLLVTDLAAQTLWLKELILRSSYPYSTGNMDIRRGETIL